MKQTTVNDCQLVDIRRYSDSKGYLSVVENGIDIPFDIKRIYYLYMVPEVARGAHAHKALQQLLIATSGSVDVITDDVRIKRRSISIVHGKGSLSLPVSGVTWRTSPVVPSSYALPLRNTMPQITSAITRNS